MDANEFRRRGVDMVNYIADYFEGITDRNVMSNVEPGYLRKLLPDEAPVEGEDFGAIMADVESKIMPGVTHWQSPHFHAYYPANTSYPGILADMLTGAIGCIGFSWICSPACTELETIVMDWLGKALGLPAKFLSSSGKGSGVIQGTASEALMVALLAARARAFVRAGAVGPEEQLELQKKLVVYSSDQAHSSIEKGGIIAGLQWRALRSGTNFALEPATLAAALEEDRARGLIPLFVCVTLGTTSSCAFDPLADLAPIAKAHDLWLHVDAAYAGSCFVCPEFRHLYAGIEDADSFNFNPHKWLLTNFDCSAMWVHDRNALINAFKVDPEYLKNPASDGGLVNDYRDWQIPLGRRFRSLKLWFVMRTYGVAGLQRHIRTHVELAELFEHCVRDDDRFEVVGNPRQMGLVVFRAKAGDAASKRIMDDANNSGKIFFTHTVLRDLGFVLRFAVCAPSTTKEHILKSWSVISETADKVLAK